MASYKQGILGAFSGKLGNVIGTFWKGINVMRVVPANVTNPNTMAQQAQLAKFKLLVQFLSANAKFFKIGFSAFSTRMTEMNSALKANFETGVSGLYPDLNIDAKNLVASKGELPSLKGFTATSTAPNTVEIEWDDNSSAIGAAGSDKINIAAFDELTGDSVTMLRSVDRMAEGTSLALPEGWSGKTVSVYAYAVTEDSEFGIKRANQVSDQVKVNGVTIA